MRVSVLTSVLCLIVKNVATLYKKKKKLKKKKKKRESIDATSISVSSQVGY